MLKNYIITSTFLDSNEIWIIIFKNLSNIRHVKVMPWVCISDLMFALFILLDVLHFFSSPQEDNQELTTSEIWKELGLFGTKKAIM